MPDSLNNLIRFIHDNGQSILDEHQISAICIALDPMSRIPKIRISTEYDTNFFTLNELKGFLRVNEIIKSLPIYPGITYKHLIEPSGIYAARLPSLPPIQPGCSIGLIPANSKGTVGLIVTNKKGEELIVTCAHVLEERFGTAVSSPSPRDGNYSQSIIGNIKLHEYERYDFALSDLTHNMATNRVLKNELLYNNGSTLKPSGAGMPQLDEVVYKAGVETRYTEGQVSAIEMMVRMRDTYLYGFEVIPTADYFPDFARNQDSGSMIVSKQTHEALGLASMDSTDSGREDRVICAYLKPALEKFELQIKQ